MARKKTHEEFVTEVKALVGDEYTVVGTYEKNNVPIEMYHDICGETFSKAPHSFLGGSRCPKCANRARASKRLKTHETFVKEVEELGLGEYLVSSAYKSAHEDVTFHHTVCGETYTATPNAFIQGRRCPICAESKGEKAIATFLRKSGIKYEREYQFHVKQSKYPYKLDFLVEGVAIEFDGIQHYQPVDQFKGEIGFQQTQRRDRIKDKYCVDNGIPLIRIPYWEYDNIDAILTEKLLPTLENREAC